MAANPRRHAKAHPKQDQLGTLHALLVPKVFLQHAEQQVVLPSAVDA
jgi:hypothetical protein